MSIENGKIYKNWREVCNALDVNYKKSTGDAKKALIKELELEYKIIKDGWKMKFDKLSKEVIKKNMNKFKADNIISDKFNNPSKLFQAKLIEYITIYVNQGKYKNCINMNMYGLLKSVNLLNSNHGKVNYAKYDKENEIHDIDEKVTDKYIEKYYSDAIRLYERGLDNLMKKKIIQYEKRHNITYNIFNDDNELIKEESHKMTNIKEENAILNAERDAWRIINKLFDLNYKKIEKDDEDYHINFFAMFSDGVNHKCMEKKNSIDLSNLNKKEINLFNQFFGKETYTLYTLFRELSSLYTGYKLEIVDFNGNRYEVSNYYKAYNIMIAENLFKDYNKQMIKSVLLENENKDANADYMIQRMYKGLSKNHYDKAGLLKEIVKVCSYVSPKPSDLDEMNKHYKELFNIENVKIDADLPF